MLQNVAISRILIVGGAKIAIESKQPLFEERRLRSALNSEKSVEDSQLNGFTCILI